MRAFRGPLGRVLGRARLPANERLPGYTNRRDTETAVSTDPLSPFTPEACNELSADRAFKGPRAFGERVAGGCA